MRALARTSPRRQTPPGIHSHGAGPEGRLQELQLGAMRAALGDDGLGVELKPERDHPPTVPRAVCRTIALSS